MEEGNKKSIKSKEKFDSRKKSSECKERQALTFLTLITKKKQRYCFYCNSEKSFVFRFEDLFQTVTMIVENDFVDEDS